MTLRPLDLAALSEGGLLPQAIIGRPIEELLRGREGRVQAGQDDLDSYESAAFALDTEDDAGIRFALKYYRGHPDGTVTVYPPSGIDAIPQITAMVANILANLGLDGEALLWQRAENPDL